MNDQPSLPPPVDPRIPLAAERTLLAWIRTGVGLMGFGLVVAKLRLFLDEILAVRGIATPVAQGASTLSGIVLVLLGTGVLVAATVRHQLYLRDLRRLGPDAPLHHRFPLLVAIALAVVGLLLAVNLRSTEASLHALPNPGPPATNVP